jgi:hypothetical protein
MGPMRVLTTSNYFEKRWIGLKVNMTNVNFLPQRVATHDTCVVNFVVSFVTM